MVFNEESVTVPPDVEAVISTSVSPASVIEPLSEVTVIAVPLA